MMRKIDRLRSLKMRVARNDYIQVALGQAQESLLQFANLRLKRYDFIPQPESDVQRHLVVPRPGSVQLGARWITRRQSRLNDHVNVLEIGIPLELGGTDLMANFFQSLQNIVQLRGVQHADF